MGTTMDKPTICTVNIFTRETETREMTEDEYAELLASLVSGMPEEPA
jgi:hypothetical protein